MENRIIEVGDLSNRLWTLRDRLMACDSFDSNALIPGDNLRPVYERLLVKGASFGVTFKTLDVLQARRFGYFACYNPTTNVIELPLSREDLEFYRLPVPTYNTLASLLAHELGHERTLRSLFTDTLAGIRTGTKVSEVVAESVSSLVMDVYGVDTSVKSCGYMRRLGGPDASQILETHGALILKAASDLIN